MQQKAYRPSALTLIDQIEHTARVACDPALSAGIRVAAAGEVMMWAGTALSREALSRHINISAGCVSDSDGCCQCDAWAEALRLLCEASRTEETGQ